MTGIIIAGGKNTRMGREKAFLDIGGERIIDRILSIYRDLFDEVIIVTNNPLAYGEFDALIVTDLIPGKGALGGIYTGLFYSSSDHAFVAACDMPFLDKDFIREMMHHAETADIVVPRSPDGLQPLHAIYARKYLPAIEKRIRANELKITGFYGRKKTEILPPEIITRFDPDHRMFVNVNTENELSQVQSLAAIDSQ